MSPPKLVLLVVAIFLVNSVISQTDDLQVQIDGINTNIDTAWLILTGAMVLLMQLGFAMVQAGNVRSKHVLKILSFNAIGVCFGAIFYYAVGYNFGFGPNGTDFIGERYWALSSDFSDYASWFFQFTLAATSAAIVSNALAERTKFIPFIIFSGVITGFIYPVITHWTWSSQGWLTPFRQDALLGVGFIDFAGSTVVHSVGGWAALCGAFVVGPRLGRFDNMGVAMGKHSLPLITLGTMILWVGWYGFNCGSTLAISGGLSAIAGRVAVTTTLSAGAGGYIAMLTSWHLFGTSDAIMTLNGILGGLVSISSGCATVEPWGACAIGGVAGAVVVYGTFLLKKYKIDDPVGAIPVHLFNGIWGTLGTGLLSSRRFMDDTYGRPGHYGAIMGSTNANLLVVQIYGILSIAAWSVGTSMFLFLALKYTIGLRVEREVEEGDLDDEHKGKAYPEFGNRTPTGENVAVPTEEPIGGEGQEEV